MATKKKHYANYLSPGTFVAEESAREVSEWSAAEACNLAKDITERYGAKPYGFYFTTVLTADPVPDGQGGTLEVEEREIAKSGLHHLGGRVETFDEVAVRNDPKERVLRSNMQCNRWPLIVVNENSYRHVWQFEPEDVVVNPKNGTVIERGDAPDRAEYRAHMVAKWDEQSKLEYAEWQAQKAARG